MIVRTSPRSRAARRAAFTLLEVLVVVAILVILASVATIATFKYLEDAKKTNAQLKAKGIATAAEAYYLNPNSGSQFPTSIQDLANPPWGGGSFLKDPQQDMLDPWGKMYVLSVQNGQDGTQQVIVTTTANDGTQISQFGQGQNSRISR